MTWKPIIAGVDGSGESLRAAVLARRIANAGRTTCRFVYAVPELWPSGTAYASNAYERLKADGRRYLQEALRSELPAVAENEIELRVGRAGDVLAAVARESGAELIVVGGRHHAALSRTLGGSTAHHLVRTVDAAVLVVAPSARPLRRVLVALDLSKAATPTLAAARRYADVFQAGVRALHVVEPAKYPTVVPLSIDEGEFERRSREAFEKIAPDVDHVIRRGLADEAIAAEATAGEADLIVVGSHGKGWMHRMLIGSTTERLLNLLPTSLLVVPVSRLASRRTAKRPRAVRKRARSRA